MNHIRKIVKFNSLDIGYHESNLEPKNGKGRVGKSGIDKNYNLSQLIELAHEIKANIIVKGGPNAKWYLKRFNLENIPNEIPKQYWRNTSRSTTWIIEWDT